MSRNGSSGLLTVSVVIWAMAVCGGILALACYSNTAGQQPILEQSEDGAAGQFRLLMFVHPQCPCTRASVQQLAQLMAKTNGRLDAEVYFYEPAQRPVAWSENQLRSSVDRIPNVAVIRDQEAAVARSYSAATSGQTLLYDGSGRLLFSGGITAGRGHEGDNQGQQSVLALVDGQISASLPVQTPVFGCPIYVAHP